MAMDPDTYDHVVVGSGAGGGTVAERLAEAGYSVSGERPTCSASHSSARSTATGRDRSQSVVTHRNRLTWAVLKGHTNNRAGTVRLKSPDPLEPPEIRFRYFEEGSEGWREDLSAVVSDVKFVRSVMRRLIRKHLVLGEVGTAVHQMSDRELADFVRDSAWGHHACGTCAIGRPEEGGVIDSRFRVHGVEGLRIADASVFPRIPGLFIVSAVYMIGEKAAEAILSDAGSTGNHAVVSAASKLA